MSRSSLTLRDATAEDAARLAQLWTDVIRRGDPEEQAGDVERVIVSVAEDPTARVVVAEYDGQVAGAVLLRAATITPLNLEPVIQAVSPHVFPEFRRHGVGTALVAAAADFADEHGIGVVASASVSASREANRFMARLGLGPQAMLRAAATSTLRDRIAARTPAAARPRKQIRHVLAVRRSQRERGTDPVTGKN